MKIFRLKIENLLLVLVLFFILPSCGKKDKKCPELFQLTGQVIPYSAQYNLGDTISIISQFDKSVYEKTCEEYFDMTGIDWNPGLIIYRLDTIETVYNFTNNFNLVSDSTNTFELIGDTEQNYLRGHYFENEEEFFLELNFNLLDTGLYMLGFGPFLFENHQDFPGKCDEVGFEAHISLNQDQDNNISLLNESPNEHFNTWILLKPEDRFYNKGSFAFRVVE